MKIGQSQPQETKRAQPLTDQPEIPPEKMQSEQRVPLSSVLMTVFTYKTRNSLISDDES